MGRKLLTGAALALSLSLLAGCGGYKATKQNTLDTKAATETLLANQKSPTDIDYSLERYNLIKRAYWVNGHREKAMTVPCAVDRPIGYIVLITGSGSVLGSYTVDGKITSLNSFLSPDSEWYEYNGKTQNHWLADVDGSYGENTNGVFWFTVDGDYMEWNGQYLYSDIPFKVDEPILKVGGAE